ncbi:MAG: hypothetical protein U0892_22100 [Pirellulales bacterium]
MSPKTRERKMLDQLHNSQGVYAFHLRRSQLLLVDGSVQFPMQSIDPNVLFGLVTISAGEVPNLDF